MEKLIVRSHEEFEALVGQVLGTSSYMTVTQEQINKFADATFDHQWIHVDEETAKREGAFGSTIAHGYLTLSLLPYLWGKIIQVNNLKMMVNYGMDKMRFGCPVLSGSRLRLVTSLASIENLRGICKVGIDFKMEVEGQKKPALKGLASFLYYFK